MTATESTTTDVTAEPPDFPVETVAAVVEKNYGLVGDYKQLVSERDQNLRLTTPDGSAFVVKVTGLAEDPIATDFQIEMLCHFAENGFDLAPRICKTLTGSKRATISSASGDAHSLRIVTWLDGTLLHDVGLTTANCFMFGQRLAELDLVLADFEFNGNGQAGMWDMQEFHRLESLLKHINDDQVLEYASATVDRFADSILPALRSLPKQAIHNDANPENILISSDGDLAGFIDFGDALKAPRVIELAIAASYLRTDGSNPIEYIEAFVTGYLERNPLTDSELTLLYDLIKTRLATTLIIMYWRLGARDQNDPYRMKTIENESNAFDLLVHLSGLGPDEFNQRVGITSKG